MARPQKETIEYFPHVVNHGRTMFVIESKYGNDGYAFWFKLLEILCISKNQSYDFSTITNWEFLLAKTHVSEVSATEILKTLADIDAIDKELYRHKIIWVQNLVNNLEDVYKKRAKGKPLKPTPNLTNPLEVDKPVDSFRDGYATTSNIINSFRVGNTVSDGVSGNIYPQSKLNQTKPNQTKEDVKEISASDKLGEFVKLYENTCGPISNITLRDNLIDACEQYSCEWFSEACKEASISCNTGRPNLKFILSILERWGNFGFKAPFKGKNRSNGHGQESGKSDKKEFEIPYFSEGDEIESDKT